MKQEKMKEFAVTNLTYCRLKADLAAVELEIAGNSPVAETEESATAYVKYLRVYNGNHIFSRLKEGR